MLRFLFNTTIFILISSAAQAEVSTRHCPDQHVKNCDQFQPLLKPVPQDVLNDIIGQAAPRWREVESGGELKDIVDSKLIGTIFNGNVDWAIDNLVVQVRLGESELFEEYQVTFADGHLKPLSESKFAINIENPEDLPNLYSWRISKANGFKVN